MNTYENAKIDKEWTEKWHDKHISRRRFNKGDLVLLFNSRLRLFPRKLCSRWSGPFEAAKVFQNGAMEIKGKFNEVFVVNG